MTAEAHGPLGKAARIHLPCLEPRVPVSGKGGYSSPKLRHRRRPLDSWVPAGTWLGLLKEGWGDRRSLSSVAPQQLCPTVSQLSSPTAPPAHCVRGRRPPAAPSLYPRPSSLVCAAPKLPSVAIAVVGTIPCTPPGRQASDPWARGQDRSQVSPLSRAPPGTRCPATHLVAPSRPAAGPAPRPWLSLPARAPGGCGGGCYYRKEQRAAISSSKVSCLR